MTGEGWCYHKGLKREGMEGSLSPTEKKKAEENSRKKKGHKHILGVRLGGIASNSHLFQLLTNLSSILPPFSLVYKCRYKKQTGSFPVETSLLLSLSSEEVIQLVLSSLPLRSK